MTRGYDCIQYLLYPDNEIIVCYEKSMCTELLKKITRVHSFLRWHKKCTIYEILTSSLTLIQLYGVRSHFTNLKMINVTIPTDRK